VKPSGMLVIGLLAVAVSAAMPAAAQERYPLRPVRLVIPSVPAGVHDVIGRVWAERVRPLLGAIVIDNRGGGAGSIGANDVAHSPPDGYSILLGSTTTHVLVPPVMANPPYDPVKDFSAVTVFAYSSTSIEAGLPGMVAQTTFGIFAPAGTPAPILERINAVTQQALADGDFQSELVRLGFEPVRDVGPDKAAGVFQDELARWTPILKAVGRKPE